MGIVEDLDRARQAFERRDWAAAYRLLTDVQDLPVDDLETLAISAELLGDVDTCIRMLQRGFQAELARGRPLRAVRYAFRLGMVLSLRGEQAVAAGWTARAQRLLADLPADDPAAELERGYLTIHEFFRCVGRSDFEGALAAAAIVTETGRRFGDADLVGQGLISTGRMLIYAGRVPEGLALLDEAMIGVAAGELTPIFSGQVFCAVIDACQEISDFARMSAWTSALTRWCDGQPDLVLFTGQCAVHRGQVLRWRGEFTLALDELGRACDRYARAGQLVASGLALAERGDVFRLRGEFAEAERCYDQASGIGHETQPGLALLWLARGRTDSAVTAVRRLLAEPADPVHRCRLLPAAIEVFVAGGCPDQAAPVAVELTAIAESFDCAGLRAMAAYGSALVALATGDHEAALPAARLARRLWTDLEAPYEVARARVLLGRVYRAAGDEDSAVAELAAALRVFQGLGTAPAEREVAQWLNRAAPGGLTRREVEVLRLVAQGSSNTEIARTLVLSDKTVARHLSNIFGKLGVQSRTAAVAYAHDHDLLR